MATHSSVVPRPTAASAATCPAKKGLKGSNCVPVSHREAMAPLAAVLLRHGSIQRPQDACLMHLPPRPLRLLPLQCADPLCINCQANFRQCKLCAAELWDPSLPITYFVNITTGRCTRVRSVAP